MKNPIPVKVKVVPPGTKTWRFAIPSDNRLYIPSEDDTISMFSERIRIQEVSLMPLTINEDFVILAGIDLDTGTLFVAEKTG
jgi:hypothetical protein